MHFNYCEITALGTQTPTILQPYLHEAHGIIVLDKLGLCILISLNYADFASSLSRIFSYRVEFTAKLQ
jgi:hypothetical protein